MKKRKFVKGAVNHCYQRLADRGVLFYNIRDHLVFFSIFSIQAKRHKVRVLKLVQMPDHLHHSSIAETADQLSAFVRDCMSVFAREYNKYTGRKGQLFESTYCSVPKIGDKAVRTNLLYLDNNPVERKLVKKASDYQWNYLAYASSKNPFSKKIRLRFASMPLRRALKRVKYLYDNDLYLTYEVITNLLNSIADDCEKDQLTDYIVNTYSVIDHVASIRFFDGYDNELLAAASNTGSEYDINESFLGKDDRYYSRFSHILINGGYVKDIHEIFRMDDNAKQMLYLLLRSETMAPMKQIAAFLHLPVGVKI